MFFYKIEATRQIDRNKEMDRQEIKVLAEELQGKSESYYQNSNCQSAIFAANINLRNANCDFGIITREETDIEQIIKEYFSELPFEIEKYTVKETTFSDIRLLLRNAERSGCVYDAGELFLKFGIGDIAGMYFQETLIEENRTFDEMCNDAENILFDEMLIPEFKRIYTPPTKKIKGHPVHYLIHGKSIKNNCKMCDNLLSALYQNGRIDCKRVALIYTSEIEGASIQKLNSLYNLFDGGAIIVCYKSEDYDENEYRMSDMDEVIKNIGELANYYKNKVLTIINLENASNKIREDFYLNCSECTFIELHEGLAYGEKAINLLKKRAKDNEIEIDEKLISSIDDKGYNLKDINRIFDNWYSNKLKNDIYPQYKTSEPCLETIKNEAPKGNAYEKLNNLIGIGEAKKTMNNILDYFKAQKVFAERGVIAEKPSMHMVFTGNPGTAKTTVARLFAQIMKENNLLNGNILEVGRADLIGKYVGSTAPLVKKAFQKAKGGVLFIDEAYSLVDGKDGLYGDEAINTIVQEMENNRSDTVVIFAGYPDKMESFLNKNPGLRSRIAFHVNFDDYNSEELLKIFEFIAEEKGMNVSEDAREKLLAIFDDARKNSDFGNGRYARNIFEKVKMTQASRLMKMKLEDITDDNLKNIHAEDIETPDLGKKKTQKAIGF